MCCLRNRLDIGQNMFAGNKKTQVWARIALPILVQCAQQRETIKNTELSQFWGRSPGSYMRFVLGNIVTTLAELEQSDDWEGGQIPHITSIVLNANGKCSAPMCELLTGDPTQQPMPERLQAELDCSFNYEGWDAVLDALSLEKQNMQGDIMTDNKTSKQTTKEDTVNNENKKIFIGHGRSLVWQALKDFIVETLGLEYEEFNRITPAGQFTGNRLKEMLDEAGMAFLIMTGEDEQPDGTLHARNNVIHEIGLFQAQLGYERAIILLEEGCEIFSNIQGITYIPFPKGNISAAFEEIRRVLQREFILE